MLGVSQNVSVFSSTIRQILQHFVFVFILGRLFLARQCEILWNYKWRNHQLSTSDGNIYSELHFAEILQALLCKKMTKGTNKKKTTTM